MVATMRRHDEAQICFKVKCHDAVHVVIVRLIKVGTLGMMEQRLHDWRTTGYEAESAGLEQAVVLKQWNETTAMVRSGL
jgi:hypothetical protein